MARSRFGGRRIISGLKGTQLKKSLVIDYSSGFNSYLANDALPENTLRLAQDARISTLGRMITRRGASYYSDAAGETLDDQETSTTGASDEDVTTTTWQAARFTTTTAGRLTKVELNLKTSGSPTGVVRVDIYDDDSGEPGVLVASSSVHDTAIGSSYAYEVARFIEAPALATSTNYWIVARIQGDGTGTYNWSSNTNATTSLESTNSGVTWSSTSRDLNFKTYLSTNSPSLGLYRAYKSGGTEKTLLAHGTTLYSVDDSDGSLDSVKTGLSANGKYRFTTVNDTVYYVNGVDSARKWDFSTDSAWSGSGFPTTPTNIIAHQDLLFVVDGTDPTKIVFSNEDDYETADSTNFIYVPSPKSPEPITGWQALGGILHIFTRQNKWSLFGTDARTFELVAAPASKGTYSQESIAASRNHIYFMSDDGVYRFNGTADELISAPITDKIEAMANKEKAVLHVNKNRLYIYYPAAGSGVNNKCLVYNIDYGAWESEDTNQYVGLAATQGSGDDSSEHLIASSVTGQVFKFGGSSNNHEDVGAPLSFELRTRYEFYGEPAAKKRPKRWYPRFEAQTRSYTVDCEYDKDFSSSPTSTSINVGATGETWGGGAEFGDGSTFGSTKLAGDRITVPGNAKYIQYRIKKSGVDVPVEFIGNTFLYKQKRLR